MTDAKVKSAVAILFGSSIYTLYPTLEPSSAFLNSKNDFRRYLVEKCQIPVGSDGILDLFNKDLAPGEIIREIRDFIKARNASSAPPSDIIFYYCGHGAYLREHEYFLALSCTNIDAKEATVFKISYLVDIINDLGLGSRILIIIDACYSGAALIEFGRGELDDDATIAIKNQILSGIKYDDSVETQDGSFNSVVLFCAAGPRNWAKTPIDARNTMFSGALLRVLEIGDKRTGAFLDLRNVARLVKSEIKKKFGSQAVTPQIHVPVQGHTDVLELPYFPNPGFQSSQNISATARTPVAEKVLATAPDTYHGLAAGATRGDQMKTRGEEISDYREAARIVQTRVLQYFTEKNDMYFGEGDDDAPAICYALRSRVKSKSRISEKIEDRVTAGVDYSIANMPDICGLRIVTLYQDQIPHVLKKLLNEIKNSPSASMPFKRDGRIQVDINTSARMNSDPLSLSEPIKQIINQVGLSINVKEKVHETGYSSIHVVAPAKVNDKESSVSEILVEMQIRSAFEDVWSEVDHKIDYSHRRGKKEIPRNRHLTILKGFVDNVISYVDEIKRRAKEPTEEVPAARSLQRPEGQVEKLQRNNVPADYVIRIEKAYRVCADVFDRSAKVIVEPEMCRKGAKEFALILADVRADTEMGKKTRDVVVNVCEMEYAYLLLFTGNTEDTDQAEKVYLNVIAGNKNESTAHYRLGGIYRDKKRYQDSVNHLQMALEIFRRGDDENTSKEIWFYDALRRSMAISKWRMSELEDRPYEERIVALSASIAEVMDVIERPSDPGDGKVRIEAVNDLLYYVWYAREISGGEHDTGLKEEKIGEFASELYEHYLKARPEDYEYTWLDTLVRVFEKEPTKVRKLAIEVERVIAQTVKLKFKNDNELNRLLPGSPRWNQKVYPDLDPDKLDALVFAHERLAEYGRS